MFQSEENKINTHYAKHPFIYHKHLITKNTNTNNTQPIFLAKYNTVPSDIKSRGCLTLVTHIHCQKLINFSRFFSKFIKSIQQYSSLVIITYCEELQNQSFFIDQLFSGKNAIWLKIQNKGMDIGGKIAAAHYLRENNIHYTYMLMIHSKTNDKKRKDYIAPLLQNLKNVIETCSPNLMGYFPPAIQSSVYKSVINNDNINIRLMNLPFTRKNKHQVTEMRSVLGIDSVFSMFPEGNTYMLHRTIVDDLFRDEFYPLLNSPTSFDAHWVMTFYKMWQLHHPPPIEYIYEMYKCYNLSGNNIERRERNELTNHPLYKDHPDSQFEHIFERVVWNLIQKHGGEIDIAPYSSKSEEATRVFVYEINHEHFIKGYPPYKETFQQIQSFKGDVPLYYIQFDWPIHKNHAGKQLYNIANMVKRKQAFLSNEPIQYADLCIWINHLCSIYNALETYPTSPFIILTELPRGRISLEPNIIDELFTYFSQSRHQTETNCIYLYETNTYALSRASAQELINIQPNTIIYPISQYIYSRLKSVYIL
ncbi:hypothetical protein OAA60_05895 [Porticoccaceae bacterium]|jgi:hypothetical protein|nr:hypothetical protein [Porticoccaceae bacterium]